MQVRVNEGLDIIQKPIYLFNKEGQSWRIDQFKFNLKYIDGNPNLEAGQ
jgi:hypothetical protein